MLNNQHNNSRSSFTDIKTLFNNDIIKASVISCQNGDVYMISNPNRKINIELLWNEQVKNNLNLGKTKELAEVNANNFLYSTNIFDIKRS